MLNDYRIPFLLMSIEDAGASDPAGGSTPAPASEPAASSAPSGPDSAASIMSDLRHEFAQPTAPVAEPSAPAQAAVAAPVPEAQVATPPPVAPAPTPEVPPATEVVVTPVEDAPLAAPESRFAPFFTLATMPAGESLPKAIEILGDLAAYDPMAHNLLMNSAFQAAPNTFRNWVLADMGIQPTNVDQFLDWQKNGAPQATSLGAFPEPDADGWVKLPNRTEIDTTALGDAQTPSGMERYLNAKFQHDYKVEKEEAAATERATKEKQNADQQEASAKLEYETRMGRAEAFSAERYALRDRIIDEALANLDQTDPDVAFLSTIFRNGVNYHIDNHSEILATSKQASPHVLAGDGRQPEFARATDALVRKETNTLREGLSQIILRISRAERAAIGNAPVLPAGTKTLESAAPSSPADDEPKNLQDILRQARQYDRQVAGSNR